MLTVTCFNTVTGKVRVHIPLRYRALVARYAQFNEAYGAGNWVTDTEYLAWLQLPGVVVEKP